jgi:AcrR family transcriptional regulator
MNEQVKASPRDRLLDATASLAYVDGVNVGIDALCKAAGVSKRSMYQLFASKDELLAASLERRRTAFAVLPWGPEDAGPRERILGVFEQLETRGTEPDYRGCPYLAVQIELKDPNHPASKVAHRIKDDLTDFFRQQAKRGGATDPELLARQLMLVFDGASARAGIGADSLAGLAVPTVTTLLDAAGVS